MDLYFLSIISTFGLANPDQATNPDHFYFGKLSVALETDPDIRLSPSQIKDLIAVCSHFNGLLKTPEQIKIRVSSDPKQTRSNWDKFNKTITIKKASLDDFKGVLMHELAHFYFDHLIKLGNKAVLELMDLYAKGLRKFNSDFDIFKDTYYTTDTDSFGHPYDGPSEMFASISRASQQPALFFTRLAKYTGPEKDLYEKGWIVATSLLQGNSPLIPVNIAQDCFNSLLSLSPGHLQQPIKYNYLWLDYIDVAPEEFFSLSFQALNQLTEKDEKYLKLSDIFYFRLSKKNSTDKQIAAFKASVYRNQHLLNENGANLLKSMFGVHL